MNPYNTTRGAQHEPVTVIDGHLAQQLTWKPPDEWGGYDLSEKFIVAYYSGGEATLKTCVCTVNIEDDQIMFYPVVEGASFTIPERMVYKVRLFAPNIDSPEVSI